MKVFISYAFNDKDFAQHLEGAIKQLGTSVEEPAPGPAAGTEWAKLVESSIRNVDAVLLVVPQAGSPGANNAYFEAGAARALGKQVLAVVPEQRSARLRELPTDILDVVVMDASRQSIERVARTLVGALEAA